MAHNTDAVTARWRGISLRAKVTAGTVALLAVALLASGSGTFAFLRNTLIAQVETNVTQLAADDVAGDVFTAEIGKDGELSFLPKETSVARSYFVALYDSVGTLVATAGGEVPGPMPIFPETITPEQAVTDHGTAYALPSSDDSSGFRAGIALHTVTIDEDSSLQFTQLVAAALTPTDRIMALFVLVYSVLSLVILVGSALLTRWLVTLTFRSLGQVETTAMAIADGDFSQRMTEIESRTEVGRLKHAINIMLDRIDAAITERDASVLQMRRFVGDASHELRTPLVTVRGYAELYRMGGIPDLDSTKQAMSRIEKEAIRMGLLVQDLLALARLDERRDMVIAPVDLLAIARNAALDERAASPYRPIEVIQAAPEPERDVDPPTQPVRVVGGRRARSGEAGDGAAPPRTSAIALIRRRPRPVPARPDRAPSPAEPATGVPVGQTLPDGAGFVASGEDPARQAHPAGTGTSEPSVPQAVSDAPPSASEPRVVLVWGDENRLQQVVANLLGNARRFTAENSPIELRVGSTQTHGWIEVIDHGEGIPDQVKDKIFQRFWRADSSRSRDTGGTGLGLAIVASIVDALGGTVAVTDTVGGGATFRVSLPRVETRS